MGAASQIYYTAFDAAFFKLQPHVRHRIESKIDEMGLRLETFPHVRLKGHDRYRLRVGDYRVIYTCDIATNTIHLLGLGHRREIYRGL
jgi:mRNA interferase RelE/StbE